MLSVKQVAEQLGVSPKMVRNLIASRRLKAIDVAEPGKQHCYRIKPEWVNDFIANSELPPLKVRVKEKQGLRPSKFAASREQLLNGHEANRD